MADRRRGSRSPRSTPLWYWILCEAEKAGGEHLGASSARMIVGEVLIGLIETDPSSYLRRGAGLAPGILGGEAGRLLDGLVRALRARRGAVVTDYPR